MKILRTIILTLSVVSCLTSCDEWLSASSNMEIPSDKLFATKGGFYDALSGVYISMGEDYAYGKYYTWYANDLVVYPFVTISDNALKSWQEHIYTHKTVKSEIASMWLKGYNIIANINHILDQLESHRNVITSDIEYRLIKGELLGLRAYIHFDLLRMFGLADWTGANASKLTIPYLTVYEKEPVQQKSYEETGALLMNDISDALELLKDVDPVTGVEHADFATTINNTGFWNKRTTHLNYYAVKALEARVHQWNNDTENAARCAQEVLNEVFEKAVVGWVNPEALLQTSSNDSKDWTFSCEHLFTLQVSELYNKVFQILLGNGLTTDSFYLYENFVSTVLFPIMKDGLVSGAEDVRGSAFHLKYSGAGYLCYKLYGSTTQNYAFRNRMPMVKISELYYMIAENHIAAGDGEAALAVMNTVRAYRGIKDDLPTTTDPEEELMKEYYREFISEGQLLYWIKHKGASSLSSEFAFEPSQLIYPYPDDEINYGRIQEL